MHFFLGPWFLVCQFIDISNQMEQTGKVANILQNNLYNALSNKKKIFDVWYYASCLHLIGNVYELAHWRVNDQRKYVFIFIGGGSTPDPPTLLVTRVVLLWTLYGVLNSFFPQLYINYINNMSLSPTNDKILNKGQVQKFGGVKTFWRQCM